MTREAQEASAPVRVLLVRHGETDHNVQGIIQGQLDTDLNEFGHLQAQLTAAYLADTQIDEVYTSPLKRARDTALAIVKQNHSLSSRRGAGDVAVDSRLMERYFGAAQGVKRSDKMNTDGAEPMPDVWKRLGSFWNDVICSDSRLQSSQPSEAMKSASLNSSEFQLPSLASRLSQVPKIEPAKDLHGSNYSRTVLITSHGAALRNLISGVLLHHNIVAPVAGVQEPRSMRNCSITEIVVSGDSAGASSGTINKWSDVSHLPDTIKELLVTNVDETVSSKISQKM